MRGSPRSRKPGESRCRPSRASDRDLTVVLSVGVCTRPHGPTRDGAPVDMLYDPAHDGIEEDPAAQPPGYGSHAIHGLVQAFQRPEDTPAAPAGLRPEPHLVRDRRAGV